MFAPDWTLVTMLTIVLLVLLALTFSRAWRTGQARRFSRRIGLDLPAELADTVGIRIARRNRAGAVGALAGLAIGVLVMQLTTPAESTTSFWLLLGLTFAGLGAGVTVSALAEKPADVDGPRVARSDAVGLVDYVAPVERNGARVVVGLSVLSLVGVLFLQASRGFDAGTGFTALTVAIVAFGVVSLAIFEIGSRRIIDRGRPAGSSAGLAWDDALRAANVRELVTAPLCLGLWGTMTIVFHAIEAMPEARTALILAGMIAICGAIAGAFVIAGQKPQRYFLRRLWPELAAAAR